MTRQEYLRLCAVLGAGAMLPKELLAAMGDDELKRSDFGDSFVWGTATASYQVEGGWNEDGKGESIWDHFTHHHPCKIQHHENADVADDFYHRYSSDIELMHQMYIPASRFSISWPRVLPDGTGKVNEKGIDFYNRVIDKCLEQKVDPWVTCYHWDLPEALQKKGGWINRDIIGWFEEYIDLVTKRFGDRVRNWMVFNEPLSFTVAGYAAGVHPPGEINFAHFYRAIHNVTMCHGAGGRVMRANLKNAKVGTTFSCSTIDPWKETTADKEAAKRVDVMVNRLFIEPVLGMGYPVKDLAALKHIEKYILPGDEEKMKFDFDFIGLQNYTRFVVKNFALLPIIHAINVPAKKMGHGLTQMGWEIYPEGIYRIIKQFAAYPGVKEIVITENGAAIADKVVNGEIDDPIRLQYIKDYLKYVLKAKREGINVGGYFIWSLLDNFEWAKGYTPKLGIVGVDFKTQQRIIKSSGKWYSNFLAGK
ncbi:MAG TPA: GH1 family beta-glucosidase [Chitinophagales bacterium]|nr:GH1 family beta-glucosidase [Chitinophagales bacterium]